MSDLMTFIGGAAVGTLVTYLAKNEEARKKVEHFIDGMGEAFTDFLHRMTPGAAEKTAGPENEPESETVEKAAPVRKAARPRRKAKAKKVVTEEKSIH
ncbi:MAG: hypothetical protein ABFR65_08035 [Pseudomonadota bacterium]